MKKQKKGLRILRNIVIVLAVIIALPFIVREAGVLMNRRVPSGGINESMYVDIGGTKQWISIYGENRNNPVLLYLHGGPGAATSDVDYVITRKWADVYTVVTWDQRNCGKSYDEAQNGTVLTKGLFMQDGKEMTEFIREHLSVDQITLLGHSWGSLFGANLALEYPDYYNCFIGTGQIVDFAENEQAFMDKAKVWAADDASTLQLVETLTPDDITPEHMYTRGALNDQFGYSMMRDGTDYNKAVTMFFNPYYSLSDWMAHSLQDQADYLNFLCSKDFASFSLKGCTDYQMPYYNINGDSDYQANFELAQAYFDQVNAPAKGMYMMKDTTHGLLESKSEEFSKILHQIAEQVNPTAEA